MKDVLLILVFVMGIALVAFQVYVARWQRGLPGGTTRALRVVRGVNLALVLVVLALIVWLAIARVS